MFRNSKRLLKQPHICSFSFCKYSNEIKPPAPIEKEITKEVTNENKTQTSLAPKHYDPKSVTKADLKWRTAWHEKEGQDFSLLRALHAEESGSGIMHRLLGDYDFTPSGLTKWWKEKQNEANIILHAYEPERNRVLGDELAAAHFIVSRGGAIKFFDENRWVKADKNGNYSLPRLYEDGKILEAIDCMDMDIVYESLANFRNLQQVKWLSLNGCNYIDDWCLDTIGNIFSETLIYLDLRNCPNITHRGIGALAKMNNLKILYLDDFYRATTYEMTCLLLEEFNTSLQIKSDPVTFEM